MSKSQEFYESHEATVNEFTTEVDRIVDTVAPSTVVGITCDDDLPDLWEGIGWDLANEEHLHDAADWVTGVTSRMGNLVVAAVGSKEYGEILSAWRNELDKGALLRRYGFRSIVDAYFGNMGPDAKLSVRCTAIFPQEGEDPSAVQRTASVEDEAARKIIDITTVGSEISHIVTTTVPRAEELIDRARLLLGKPLLSAMIPFINGSYASEEALDMILATAGETVRGQHSEGVISPLLAELKHRAVTIHEGVVMEIENGWNAPDPNYFEALLPYLRAA